jgi:MFS family permease
MSDIVDTRSDAGVVAPPATPGSPPPVRKGPGLIRLGAGLMIVNATTYLAIFGVLNVILPAQIAMATGEAGKEAALGIITTLGAIVAMIAGPLWGALSDRGRRNRQLGRRGPWILAGAAGLLVALNLVGVSQLILVIGLAWCLSQLAVNATLMGISTALPERVPHARRGLMSGVVGLASGLAMAMAAFVGAAFISEPLKGTLFLSILALVGAVVYLVIAPESRQATEPVKDPVEERPSVLAGMLSSLKSSAAFRWTWIGRFLVVLGYSLIQSRLLYFVQDSLGLGLADSAAVVAAVAGAGGVALMLGLIVSAPLSDRFGRKPFVYTAGVGIAAGLVVLGQADSVTSMIIANVLIGIAFGAFMGVDQALIADVLPDKKDVAKDLGVINLAATIPQTLAPAVGSLVLAVTAGSYPTLIYVGALIALGSVYATRRIKGIR